MDDERNYWDRARQRRLSRRRVLQTGASGAAALSIAAALGGCGDDDDGGKTATAATGGSSPATGAATTPQSPTTPTATTEKPRRGGTWRGVLNGDPPNLDPYGGTALTSQQTWPWAYSRLVRFKAGPGVDPGLYQTENDLAQSVTPSADGLTYTVKLKNNAKWHAPISRPVDADDVVFSFKRYTGQIAGTPANPGAALLTGYINEVVKVDNSTVDIKLKTTRGDFLVSENRFIHIMPRETGTAFNPATQMVGSGAWIFESYTAGSSMKFKRNPDWHLGPDAPYFDNAEIFFVPEYATRFQQFLAGNIDEVDILGDDLKRAKETVKDSQIIVKLSTLPNSYITFEGADRAPNAPWRDARVRQAISMALNRDAMLDGAYSFQDISKLGFKIDRVWNNEVSGWERPFWLDPQGKYALKPDDAKMSAANQAFFKYNPGDAKKLLAAAGQPNGFKTKLHTTSSRYGKPFNLLTELVQQFCAQIGVDLQIVDEDYASVYQPLTAAKGEFDGVSHIPRGAGARGQFESYYLKGGTRNNAHIDDATLTDKIKTMLGNRDGEGARKQMLDIQQYLNEKMYLIPMQLGAAGDYVGYHPKVRGITDYQVVNFDQPNETLPYVWKAV